MQLVTEAKTQLKCHTLKRMTWPMLGEPFLVNCLREVTFHTLAHPAVHTVFSYFKNKSLKKVFERTLNHIQVQLGSPNCNHELLQIQTGLGVGK